MFLQIYNPEQMKKWDKNLITGEIIQTTAGKKSYGLIYNLNKK